MLELLNRRRALEKSGHPNFTQIISFVSPEGSTPATLAAELGVDITTKVVAVGLLTAQYIYAVTTAGTTHTAQTGADSYTFGSSLDAVTTQVSNSISFTTGSIGRWVIYNKTSLTGALVTNGCTWIYFGKNIANGGVNDYNTTVKYLHYAGNSFKVDRYDYTFRFATNLTGKVTFPSYITQIGDISNYGLFDECTGIVGTITFPNSLTSTGGLTFRGCTGITDISFGSGLTSIGQSCFQNCSGINRLITIPNGVTTIRPEAFKNSWITGLVLPSSYVTMGDYPFIYMPKLTSITFGNALTNVSYIGIANCPLLPSVDLPDTVTTIGQYAFDSDTSLMSITCRATTPPTINANSLGGVPATCSIKVPAASVADYQAASVWSARAAYISAI